MPLVLRHAARAFWITALSVLALDQASKAIVRATMIPGESVRLVDGVLHLTYVRNVGAAFGLFPGRQPIFIITSVVVLVVIAAYWRRARPNQWPIVVALGLVAGGAVGNLIDRAALGRVTDFFEFGFIDFPVWNVADAAILSGVGILIAWLLFGPEPVTSVDASGAVAVVEADPPAPEAGDAA